MNPDVFFKNFELLADAPNGVQKLREITLKLAFSGKLVLQNLTDEPAEILFENMKDAKDQEIKNGNIRKEDSLAELSEDEIPFEVPSSWIWVRFDHAFNVIRGASPRPKGDPKYFSSIKTPYHWIKISDIRKYSDGITLTNTEDYLTEEGVSKSVYVEKGTLLLTNSATIGVPIILGINGCIHDGYLAFTYLDESLCVKKYLYYFFLYFQSELKNRAFGGAQLNLNRNIVKSLAFPLAPFEEQKRIVSKVDELMVLCDKLEAHHQKKQEVQSKLNSAALDRMLSAENQEKFEQYWQRICENFDLLYDNPENVKKLRQAIFQLAVIGKLVEQNPDEESSKALIEKIEVERRQLIKKGKIKKTTQLKKVSENEILFEVPDSWSWVRFDNVCSYIQRGKSPEYVEESDFPVIAQKCIQWDGLKIDRAKFIDPLTIDKYGEERFLCTGDLLWNSTGTGTLGRVNIYVHNENKYDKVVADSHVTVIRPLLIDSKYMYLWIASPIIQNNIESIASGSTNQIELAISTVKNQVFPLPPLAEQKRIVEKFERLMVLCDELEAKLKKERENSEKLMEAVVKSLLKDQLAESLSKESTTPYCKVTVGS